MADYPSVVNSSKKLLTAKYQVKHMIETTCPHTVKAHYRCLDKDKLAMDQQGIVRQSPLNMVKKKDGKWQPYGDYRQLNLATKPVLYLPLHIKDLSIKLEGMKVFSNIDLRKGYWQVLLAAADVPKMTMITPFGLWDEAEDVFWAEECGPDLLKVHG